MRAKYLLPLMALTTAAAMAGERENFDFDWKFKYFGGYDPALAGSAAAADSYQGGHPASHAVEVEFRELIDKIPYFPHRHPKSVS